MTTTTEFVDAAMKDLMAAKPKRTPDETTDEYVMRCMSAAVANSIKTLMAQEPVGVTDMAGGIHWKRGTPIQAKLYAAPMPQANESEAVKALRELHDAWADNSNDLPRMAAIKRIADRRLAAMKAARAVLAGEPGAKVEPETMEEIHRQERERPYAPVIPVNPHDHIQPKQAQAMDEREAIKQIIIEHLTGVYICNRVWEAWNVGTMDQDDFEPAQETELPDELADALMARSALAVSKTSEQNLYLAQSGVKDNQARAALAQAQDVGPTQQQEAALQALADEAQALGLYDAQARASGKAAPSDEDLQDVMDEFGTPNDWNGTITYIREQLLAACRELLAKYGNA